MILKLAILGAILFTLVIWYFIISKYFYSRPLISFSVYLLFMICLPNSIGFHYKIDHRLWQFLAIIFLLPPIFNFFIHKNIKFDSMDITIILLVFLGSITTFIWGGKQSGVGQIYKGFLYIFLPYLAGRYFIKNEKNFLKIMNVLTWSAITVSIIALMEFFTGKAFIESTPLSLINLGGWGSGHLYIQHGQFRIASSFTHPIYLGTFLLFVTIINLLLLLNKNGKLKSGQGKYLFIQIGLSGVVLIISQARTAIVAFSFVMVIYLILNIGNIKKTKLIKYISIISIITLPLFFHFFYNYFTNFWYRGVISVGATSNLETRILAAKEGIRILSNDMNWFGETSRIYYGKWTLDNTELSNGFINELSLKGIFYFLIYIFVWWNAFRSAYKMKKYNNIIGVLLLYILLYLFVVNNITQLEFQNDILFYIFVGFTVSPALHFKNRLAHSSR